MIVDFHVHVFPDSLARSALSTLEQIGKIKAHTDGTVSDLLRSMDRAGIDAAVLCPVATKPEQVASINTWVAAQSSERLIPFGTLFPRMRNLDDEVRNLVDRGIRGVKLHPDYQRFFADDETVFPVYEFCLQYNLMVLFHAGVDIGMPDPVHARPRAIAQVLSRFPGLTVIAAHMGGYLLWDEVMEHLAGKDIYFDTAYCLNGLSEAAFLVLMRKHGSDRVLFATDSPWMEQSSALDEWRRWSFTEEERYGLFGGNAACLLKLEKR